MTRRMELLAAWSGVPFILGFFIGLMLLAGFIPPVSPMDSVDQIAARYSGNTLSIQLGLLVCYLGTVFFFTFAAAISGQTGRIPGVSRMVMHCQIASFCAAGIVLVFSIIFWWTASFRVGHQSAELTQLMNDLGWITFVVGFVPYQAWAASVGAAILSDASATPLYPRWAGYFSLFSAFALYASSLLVLFKSGPFAWDGLFGWYVPLFDFFSWMIVMIIFTIKAVNRKVDPAPHPA